MHGRPSVRPSVRLSHRLQQRRAAGLLPSAVRAGYIDRQRHVPGAYIAATASQRTAAVRRSAANADCHVDTDSRVDESEQLKACRLIRPRHTWHNAPKILHSAWGPCPVHTNCRVTSRWTMRTESATACRSLWASRPEMRMSCMTSSELCRKKTRNVALTAAHGVMDGNFCRFSRLWLLNTFLLHAFRLCKTENKGK